MALQSMTGFARYEGTTPDGAEFVWELRSVNGKGLDLRLRLPPGCEAIEIDVRKIAATRLSRGNVQANLQLRRPVTETQPKLNEALLRQIVGWSDRLVAEGHATRPSADGLLALRGVLDGSEDEDPDRTSPQRLAAFARGFDAALERLVAAREGEGAALGDILAERLGEIARLTREAERDPSRSLATIRARLAAQVAELTGSDDRLDEARLHQEVALIATRGDIREELDRLKAHVAQGRALLDGGGPVGRRLDFLAQEFNRESNTICSKAGAASLTVIGLELKVVVDQLREQVQNIE